MPVANIPEYPQNPIDHRNKPTIIKIQEREVHIDTISRAGCRSDARGNVGAPAAPGLAIRLRAVVDLAISGDVEMTALCHVQSRKTAAAWMGYGQSCRRRSYSTCKEVGQGKIQDRDKIR